VIDVWIIPRIFPQQWSWHQSLAFSIEKVRELVAQDPVFAEDIRSLRESMPFVIMTGEASAPLACQYCSTPIHAVPERNVADPDRIWHRALWEPETGRKHTERRCRVLRAPEPCGKTGP